MTILAVIRTHKMKKNGIQSKLQTRLFGQCIKAGEEKIIGRFGGIRTSMGKEMGVILRASLSPACSFLFSLWRLTGRDLPEVILKLMLCGVGTFFSPSANMSLAGFITAPRVRRFFARNLSALTFLDFGSSANCLLLVSRPMIRLFATIEGNRGSEVWAGQIVLLSTPSLCYAFLVFQLQVAFIGLFPLNLSLNIESLAFAFMSS